MMGMDSNAWAAPYGFTPKMPRLAGVPSVSPGVGDFVIGRDTNQMGSQTVPRIVHTFTAEPIDDGATANIPRFSTFWLKLGQKSDLRAAAPENVLLGMATHVLNYRLAMHTLEGKIEHVPTIESVRAAYAFDGVMYTENPSVHHGNGDRSISVDTQHYHGQVHNIWDTRVRAGDYLYLIVKLVAVGKAGRLYRPLTTQQERRFHARRTDGKELEYPGYIVQAVPYYSNLPYVDDSALRTRIPLGGGLYKNVSGFAVRLGIVFHVDPLPPTDLSAGATDAVALISSPIIQVHVSVP
jgi:hypothetical protein